MDPFKVRPGEGKACLEVARHILGQPVDVLHEIGPPEKISMHWHFYEDIVEVGISITHHQDSDHLIISKEDRRIRENQTLCGVYNPGCSLSKLEKFVETVRKPWNEWTEEEVMENPMWVCLYREGGNEPTPAMESMMHMLSFQDSNEKWVRRWFGGRK